MSGSHPTRWWVNGRESTTVHAADRGLQYGDGVFETLRIRAGQPRFATLHWQRLQQGCERLQISGVDVEQIDAQLRDAVHDVEFGMAKIIVTRGIAEQRGYAPGLGAAPTWIMTVTAALDPWPTTARVQFSSIVLGESPMLAGIKHLNRLENVLARTAQPAECEEVLMCSSHGNVIGGSSTNVFAVKSGVLLTPRVDRCGVAGIMRRVVMREARTSGVEVLEENLLPRDLLDADELFLTNVRVGVWPIVRLQQRALPAGAITAALHARVEALDGSG